MVYLNFIATQPPAPTSIAPSAPPTSPTPPTSTTSPASTAPPGLETKGCGVWG
ncbi:hypothetical protein Hanom_Chr16g01462831 [Helianthus anomalus]